MALSKSDPVESCARILLAITKDWKPADGLTTTLTDARTDLAKLVFALDGEGFPAGEAPLATTQDVFTNCLAAADAAHNDPTPASYTHAVFWPAKQNMPSALAEGLPAKWPYSRSTRYVRGSAPIIDSSGSAKRLFFFNDVDRQLDTDSGPGFWPRSTAAGQGLSSGSPTKLGPDSDTGSATGVRSWTRQKWFAMGLFLAWLAIGLYVAIWVWFIGSMAQNVWTAFHQDQATIVAADRDVKRAKRALDSADKAVAEARADAAKVQAASAREKTATELANKTQAAQVRASAMAACVEEDPVPKDKDAKPGQLKTWVGRNCESLWTQEWNALLPEKPDKDASFGDDIRYWFSQPAPLNLLPPFIVTMGSIALFVIAAGLGLKNLWFGALIDSRKRFSLSQTQQIAWSVLLLAAISVAAFFNAGVMQQPIPSSAEFLPGMNAALWAALGINLVASPFLSAVILDNKEVSTGTRDSATLITPAPLDHNMTAQEASWLDLVTSEVQGQENQLDVSRMQHVIISGILLTIYFTLVAKMLSTVSGELIANAFATKSSPFPALPEVGATFLSLLLLSHAGYLAFKARATPTPSSPVKPGTQ